MNVLLLIVLLIVIVWCATVTSSQQYEEFFPFLTDPQLSNGDQFYLRTVNGQYVSVCYSCKPNDQNLYNQCSANLCIKSEPAATSIFTYEPHRDGTFSVKTYDGHYWKRCDNCFNLCPNIICADGVNANLQTSKFVLIKNDDSVKSVSIKTDTGRMFETQNCEQSCGEIIAAQGVGINKQFVIEKLPPPYTPPVRDRKPTKKFLMPSYAPLIIPFQD